MATAHTFTIRLFLPGNDTAVAIYKGCKEFHTKDDGRQLVFIRASGRESFSNLYFEAVEEGGGDL